MTTIKTSDLCDACDGAGACALPLRGFGRRRAFAGAIRTVRCYEDNALIRDALHQPGHGQVLVVDGGGSLTRALVGDVMAELAVRNGWAGLVVNGAIRDSAEIDTMELGVKALATAPRRADRNGGGEAGGVLTFGGCSFSPGQRLIADDDGVIVLPVGTTEADLDVAAALVGTAAYAAAPVAQGAEP